MATQVQHRRGTTSQHSTFTGAVGEITVDTTKKTAVIHDGTTVGGTPLAKESALTAAAANVALTGYAIAGTAALPTATDTINGALGKLAKTASDHTSQLSSITPNFNSTTAKESASLGSELVDGTGWTSTGWTGNFATGFVHTVGQTTPLSRTMVSTGTKLYQIAFTVTSVTPPSSEPNLATNFKIKIGNSDDGFSVYRSGGSFSYTFGIRSVSDGDLVITPLSDFNGTITNISVKEITGSYVAPFVIKDSANSNAHEMRPTLESLKNVFSGKNAGMFNTTGDRNVAVGVDALAANTSGFWNVSLGAETLTFNTTGSRNMAIGRRALYNNISGVRNIGLGNFTLSENRTGTANIAIGSDALALNISGSQNISLGLYNLYNNATGNDNVALGFKAMNLNVSGSYNIALGYLSLFTNTASFNIALGYQAVYKNTSGTRNIGLGTESLKANLTGNYNVAMGSETGKGTGDTAIFNNTLIGHQAGLALITGANNNVFIGSGAGTTTTTGAGNILIGYNVVADSATRSSWLNIGGVIIGDISTKALYLQGAVDASVLPSTDPHVSGRLWVNNNVLTRSAG